MGTQDQVINLRDSEQFLSMVIQTLYLTSTIPATEAGTGITSRIAKRSAGMVEIHTVGPQCSYAVLLTCDEHGGIGIIYSIILPEGRQKNVMRHPQTRFSIPGTDFVIASLVRWLQIGG